jgi:hypothetical protein
METEQIITEVQETVFKRFLEELKLQGIEDDIIKNLTKTLINSKSYNEASLRKALDINNPGT